MSKFNLGSKAINIDNQHQFGGYGFLWSERVKGNQRALPSLKEIINGLQQFFCKYIKENFQAYSIEKIDVIQANYKRVFDFILYSIDCDEINLPLLGEFDKR